MMLSNPDGRDRNPLASGLTPAVKQVFMEQDRQNMSSTILAAASGWEKHQISQWRNGSRTPNVQQLTDLGAALGLQVDIVIRKVE